MSETIKNPAKRSNRVTVRYRVHDRGHRSEPVLEREEARRCSSEGKPYVEYRTYYGDRLRSIYIQMGKGKLRMRGWSHTEEQAWADYDRDLKYALGSAERELRDVKQQIRARKKKKR